MLNIIKKNLYLLNSAERSHARNLMAMIIFMALLDALGVASILPFIGLLINPEAVHSNALLNKLFTISSYIGIDSHDSFIFALGMLVFVLLISSLAFKAFTVYSQNRFTMLREYSIGKRFLEGYLSQPYSWFLDRNSADLGKTILSELNTVINGSMRPLVTLIAQSAVTIAILTVLIIVDPLLAFSVSVFLGVIYSFIYIFISKRLKKKGEERVHANKQRFIILSEAFGAFKVVKFAGLEESYIQRFSKPAKAYSEGQALAQSLAQLPRFALEALVFGGMLLVILYLIVKSGNFTDFLPVAALYAFAGYRLMPALQQIYNSRTQLSFSAPALDALYSELRNLQATNGQYGPVIPMKVLRSIELRQVSFRYPNAHLDSLKSINIKIHSSSTVGFVGSTGSGKTTTIDVILGLLEPGKGNLVVDDKIINDSNRRHWQCAVGYVPQHIYICDGSVKTNIAFGLNPKEVDQIALERAAKVANLHDFVVSDLPQGYDTDLGERGIRLSGGQRQRIGIARALYHNPKVLILDEATSALDNLTEQAVMEAIHNLDQEITTIIIAHRLSTLRQCDQIYLLERGEVKGQGTFEELSHSNDLFRTMATATRKNQSKIIC